MSLTVEHNSRFDTQGKLDADDWLIIPRGALAPAFTLDDAFAEDMARVYFETVAQYGIVPVRIVQNPQTVQLYAPLGKTALIFAEPERTVDAQRAETSWRIAGGFLLAHRVNYGGRFYLGGEWQPDLLKLYAAVRRYTPRLLYYFGNTGGIALYRQTQGRVHQNIQQKFLLTVATQITRARA